MIDKQILRLKILDALKKRLEVSKQAAMQAYESATHEENVAENKYDTLGLEASYLAEGQSKRVHECEADLAEFEKLSLKEFLADEKVAQGALVELLDEDEKSITILLSPVAGGLKVELSGQTSVMLVTPVSPIGKAVLGMQPGDEVNVRIDGGSVFYEIVTVR